ncbi:MAG: hypothetical protein KHW59_04260, partial [Clostridiales bacterium]|nr:hypothetical protein [Clostridiales bacterium]
MTIVTKELENSGGKINEQSSEEMVIMFAFLCMVFAMIPITVFAVGTNPSTLTTDIGEKTFTVGEATEFTFTTTANGDAGKMVTGTSNFSDPEAIEKLEYYEVNDGNWYELTGDFGPTGFPMSDATSRFRVTFKEAGEYSFTASMKEVGTEEILCSTEVSFTVNDEYVQSTLTTDIGEKTFTVGEATEFTFTTTANGDAGKMVIGTSNFSDPEAIEKLEYYEVNDGNWYEFSGDFGSDIGFPMSDATARFRVTFKEAGEYSFTASMKEVGTEEVL